MGNINFIQMKSAILALFLGATAAVQLNDAPPYFNEPTWNERMPSAAGLVQTTSACVAAGVNGVTCGPSDAVYFATGMNGDEDLGQDIIMKGEKFHYKQKQGLAQWTPVKVETAYDDLPECHGTNGPEGKNCKMAACTGTNGPKDGPAGTPCTRAEPAAIPHYNEDPTAGNPYHDSGNLVPTDKQHPASPWVGNNIQLAEAGPVEAGGPEKVSVIDHPHAFTHTTFY